MVSCRDARCYFKAPAKQQVECRKQTKQSMVLFLKQNQDFKRSSHPWQLLTLVACSECALFLCELHPFVPAGASRERVRKHCGEGLHSQKAGPRPRVSKDGHCGGSVCPGPSLARARLHILSCMGTHSKDATFPEPSPWHEHKAEQGDHDPAGYVNQEEKRHVLAPPSSLHGATGMCSRVTEDIWNSRCS